MTEKEKEYRRERMVRSLTKCNLLTMGCKTTGQVARQLRMTAKELYRELKERDILYKSDGILYTAGRGEGPRVSCVDGKRIEIPY